MSEQEKLELIHVYCDESSQCKDRYMVIGGIWIPATNVQGFDMDITNFRKEFGMTSELKWRKISKGKLNEYKKFIDIIFDYINKLYLLYRCVVVDMWQYDNQKYNKGDSELGFYKIYYQLLFQYYIKNYRYVIYPDDRQNSYKYRLEALTIILNRGIRKKYGIDYDPIRNIEPRKSHEVNLIQAVDVLTGAIAYKWNEKDLEECASPAKIEIANYIASKANMPTLAYSHTKYASPAFHIWYMDLTKSKKMGAKK